MKYLYILLLIVSSFYFSKAQTNSEFNFEFDYAQFGYDSSSNYLECYYSFALNTLSVKQTDSSHYVEGKLHITIQDTLTGKTAVDKDWMITHSAQSDTVQSNQSLIGVLGFILNSGSYKCTFTGTDALLPENNRTITEYININPFISIPLSMSDIQLASSMVQGSEKTESIFYKNTYEVVPIPTATFGILQPVLFYYIELYNIKKDNTNFFLFQNVVNSRGQVVNQKSKSIVGSVNSRVEAGSVMAYKLPTDSYSLILTLVDSTNNFGVSSSKKFFVYNPSVEYADTFNTSNTNVVSGMFGAMSDEELDDFFNKSKYVASSQEKDKYESLTEIGAKREFLTQFWNARDDNTYDGKNQSLILYMKRIEESNAKFGALSKKGWKTDRGRVYIVYGEPSEINRYPNQIETKPYEIWRYDNIEGGVEFVFGDVTGFSDYLLLHSTKRGELRDDNWQSRITVQ